MNEAITLDQVIESDYRVAVLETGEADRLLSLFKRLTLTTGRAVYDWSPEHGLYRLGIEHIFIPRTRAPADALAYIASSRHYGIYLLRGFESALGKPSIQRQLTQLIEKSDGVRRLAILLGTRIQVPAALDENVARVRHQVVERRSDTGS
jgi:hypothetical protein